MNLAAAAGVFGGLLTILSPAMLMAESATPCAGHLVPEAERLIKPNDDLAHYLHEKMRRPLEEALKRTEALRDETVRKVPSAFTLATMDMTDLPPKIQQTLQQQWRALLPELTRAAQVVAMDANRWLNREGMIKAQVEAQEQRAAKARAEASRIVREAPAACDQVSIFIMTKDLRHVQTEARALSEEVVLLAERFNDLSDAEKDYIATINVHLRHLNSLTERAQVLAVLAKRPDLIGKVLK